MSTPLLQGELVRLVVDTPEILAESHARWALDSEYWRLMDWSRAYTFSKRMMQTWFEKVNENNTGFFFSIYTLADNRLIGDIGLDGVNWSCGDSYVGIAIGERDLWGKGYGTDAMRVLLRFAFQELNLRRVTLNVFGYNPRAIQSYKKVGFQPEGCQRQFLLRDGQRYDVFYMGILRSEWAERYLTNAD